MRHAFAISASIALAFSVLWTDGVRADTNIWGPGHGMFAVTMDSTTNQLVVRNGAVDFSGQVVVNAVGQSLLISNQTHFLPKADPSDPDVPVQDRVGIDDLVVGTGIAERTLPNGVAPPIDATNSQSELGILISDLPDAASDSLILLTDDPGFSAPGRPREPNTEGVPNALIIQARFTGSLRYYDPVQDAWTAPVSNEQIRVYDWSGFDEFDATVPAQETVALLNEDSSGDQTTFSVGFSDTALHHHVGYELSQDVDGNPTTLEGVPAVGAYMIELRLSAIEDPFSVFGPPAVIPTESEPIFIIFNNQLLPTSFDSAVSAAAALPEPSTVSVVAAATLALTALRRRESQPKPKGLTDQDRIHS